MMRANGLIAPLTKSPFVAGNTGGTSAFNAVWWEERATQELASLQACHLLRHLTVSDAAADTTLTIAGKTVLSFCSNNYLGLANHPRLKEAAIAAIETWGTGAGASRLISGNMRLYEQLEERLAHFKRCDAALIFNSGYAANIGVLPALIEKGDLVLCDRLNHASLFEGCRLSQGTLRIYRHKDRVQLKSLLEKKPRDQKAWIVTDGVFSMDGDLAPLPDIVSLAEHYDAAIYLDDAHATGVLGKTGRGTCEHFDCETPRIIQMGTWSKALGSFGGFVAGTRTLISFLTNRARSLIYTTALPPAALAASLAALDLIQAEEGARLRERLWAHTSYLRQALAAWDLGESQTPILPLRVGDADRALTFSQKLFEEGIYIPAIRPPTVPRGQARLRVSLMATHSTAQVHTLVQTLQGSMAALLK